MTKSRPRPSAAPRNAARKPVSREAERRSSMARAREALTDGNWLGAIRAVASFARRTSLTPAERRTVLLVARRVYVEAQSAYRRGDRRLASQLARALRHLPGPYAQRAADLEAKIRLWLRSQRKGRSVSRVKKKSARPAKRVAVRARPPAALRRKSRARDKEEVATVDDIEYGLDAGLEDEGGVERGLAIGVGEDDESGGRGPTARRRGTKPSGYRGRASVSGGARRAAARPGGRAGRSTGARPRGSLRQRGRQAAVESTSSQADGQVVIRRTPHMTLSVPEPLNVDEAFDVDVWADEKEGGEGEHSESFAVTVPAALREFALSVTLLVSAHFRVEGDSHKELIVRRDQPETDRATFAVSVRSGRLPRSQPELTAIFSYKGRPAGKVVRQPAIAGLKPQAPAPRSLAFAPEMTVTPDRQPPPPVTEIHEDASAADLTISILDTGDKDGRHYHMIVDTATGKHWEGPWVLAKRSDELVKTAMDVFVQSEETETGPTGRIAALTGAGIDMFDATPPEFQTLFWNLVDNSKPKTILIISEEPYIPWELMVPSRWQNGKREDREPLGVEFAIGRWLHRQYTPPPQMMSFKLTYVVAPRYSSERQLRHAEKEARLVAKSFPPSRRIDPASVTTLDKSLANANVNLLHFVCHGKAEAPQTIYMDNEKDNLNCLQVKALKGFLHTFPRARTFVFLNACEVGRPAPALVGIGGLANEFLAIGAGGVIAPLWSVADDVAFDVAKEFYETVRRSPKKAFAAILQGIRRKAYSGTAEDTWAAYCFYGDPKAALHL